jgi:hypothetical protein
MDPAFQMAVELIQHMLPLLNKTQYDSSCVENKIARQIGNLIHDLPHIKTGWISKSLMRDGYRVKGLASTHEHFHSRQQAGLEIIRVWKSGKLSDKRLYRMLKKFCQVHMVTSAENITLRSIQNGEATSKLHWRVQYWLAGILLVKEPEVASRWWFDKCIIKGKQHKTLLDASKKINVDVDALKYRCNSTSKKWVDYRLAA